MGGNYTIYPGRLICADCDLASTDMNLCRTGLYCLQHTGECIYGYTSMSCSVLQINYLPCMCTCPIVRSFSSLFWQLLSSHQLNGHAIYCPRCLSPIKSIGVNTDAVLLYNIHERSFVWLSMAKNMTGRVEDVPENQMQLKWVRFWPNLQTSRKT